jgi:hypothetical protein
MARRIMLTMLTLIGVLLVAAVIPLGLITTGHDRASVQQDSVFAAGTLADSAEDSVARQVPGDTLARALVRARRSGEQVRVYDARGHLVAGNSGNGMSVLAADLASALRGGTVVAAGCLLPLPAAHALSVGAQTRTRHLAAIGMSQETDAAVIVVSEETGGISLATKGVLQSMRDGDTLHERLLEYLKR